MTIYLAGMGMVLPQALAGAFANLIEPGLALAAATISWTVRYGRFGAATSAGLYKTMPYDPLRDLVPVALIMNISYTR